LERLVHEVDARPSVASAAVPIQRGELALARGSLLALAHEIHTAEAVQPRGVAMAWKLITDSERSPLYGRTERGALLLQAESARVCLLGGNGGQEDLSSQHSSLAEGTLQGRVTRY
jgi:hypothetical protein